MVSHRRRRAILTAICLYLFAALFASARVKGSDTPSALGHAASAIFAVLEVTAARGTEEMRIVESAELLAHPKRRFDAIAISQS